MKKHDGKKFFKLALHLHTTRSDGSKTPEEVAVRYKADGYDAMAFTDHWQYGEGGELCGLKILSGCEYNIGDHNALKGVMHIVGIGMRSRPEVTPSNTRQQVVDAINASGGVAVLAHPAWSMNTTEDGAALSGVGFTEIYNAVSEAGQSMRPYSDSFVDACANRGLYYGVLATDDAHYYDGVDDRKGWVMVEADEPTEEQLKNGLMRGNFYASQGPDLYVKLQGRTLIIDCSPASVIGVLSNLVWASGHVVRGNGLTHFEYEIKDNEKWVRVEIADENGKRAWSNLFVLQ